MLNNLKILDKKKNALESKNWYSKKYIVATFADDNRVTDSLVQF